MNSIQIRQAVKSDAEEIAAFNALMALETENRTLDSQTLRNGVEAVFNDPSKGVYYVAVEGGSVIGQLMITYEWSDWRNGNFWWIQSVYVRRESRGKGVYRALHEHVHQLARERKDVCGLRLYVDGHNNRAKETYARLGMTKTEYELFEIDFVL